ncbi:MAG: hypothetical protein IJM51_04675 [Clostridia bacterium]|nr:hypothetical protein [Clostridia bacterium]
MENSGKNIAPMLRLRRLLKRVAEINKYDRYQYEIIACLTLGILFGCVTQSLYGHGNDWQGTLEGYCAGFIPPMKAVTPVTLGFLAAIFLCAPFRFARLIIYPGTVFRGMGFGALICGALQRGSLREMAFAALALLPYTAANCVFTVYAGEFALGLSEAFTSENRGMTGNLLLHTAKMTSFYLAISAASCFIFAGTCRFFGLYLI